MFKHPDAEAVSVKREIEGSGSRTVLVVRTKLPLWPMHAEYDDAKIVQLEAAARTFIARNKIDGISLVSATDLDI